ncbi:hypothetical protein GCM10027589_42090 [Actinocorallia lasiicapitis]
MKRSFAALTAAVLILAGMQGITTAPAGADSQPPAGVPATVTTDPLPTWQVNGVVWDQVLVGNTVYATGSFATARPPGVAVGGAGQVNRGNILAYDITTGVVSSTFVHTLNGQGLRMAKSPDGSRVYVAGDFTTVDGQARGHVAAFNTATGALDPNFKPNVSARIRGLAVSDTTVYMGGNFFAVNGSSRTRLGAVNAATGATLPWAPTVNDEVWAMAISPAYNRVIVGGRFTQLNGAARVGQGAVDATSGATAAWSSSPTPSPLNGNRSYPTDLKVAGDVVYGANNGDGGHWFDGRWAANVNTGDLIWLDNCYGATYSVAPIGQVLYSVSHAHECQSLGAFPEVTSRRALATTTYATSNDPAPPGSNSPITKQPVPRLLHWFPALGVGSVTGQYQAAWTVVGNDQYIAMGGEFPTVDGRAQQGLIRMAVRSSAPGKVGPEAGPAATASAVPGGGVRVTWPATWDMDNENLTYEILRDGVQIGTETQPSNFWTTPAYGFFDAAAPAGAHTYQVRAADPDGNKVTGTASASVVSAGPAAASVYANLVAGDGARHLWRFTETSGTTGYDRSGPSNLTYGSGVTLNAAGITGDRAAVFNGTANARTASAQIAAPRDFTVEAWVKTTSTTGGKIIGYGNSASGNSGTYDRHLYLTADGRVVFGVYPGVIRTIQSAPGLNNGQWHHVAASLDFNSGMKLYVDGQLKATDTTTRYGQSYTGYWRVGGDTVGSWPSAPSTPYLNGTIDEAAVYPRALADSEVAEHYQVGTGAQPNQPPVPAFTATCALLVCSFDASASADSDGTITAREWTFGDGATGSGATPGHTYAASGSYQVKLTVTDDDGASASLTKTVQAQSANLAEDPFTRTVSNGFGTAPVGGSWSTVGTAANLSVDGSTAKIALPSPSTGAGAYLTTVNATSSDTAFRASVDKTATGNGVYLWLAGRRTPSGDYRARVRFLSPGTVALALSRTDAANAETLLTPELTVPALTYTPGAFLRVRLQVTGTTPTTLTAKIWPDGTPEPATWHLTTTDSTPTLQSPGGLGLRAMLSGSATNAPTTLTLDDLTSTQP